MTIPPTAIWTSSLQSRPASPTTGAPSTSVLPATSSVKTPPLPKNVSIEPREEDATTAVSKQAATNTDSLPTSSGEQLHTPVEQSPSTPELSVPATSSQSSVAAPALTSPQAPASSPSPLSTTPPEVSSASVSTNHSSAENSTQPTGAPTAPKSTAEEHSSGHTPSAPASAEPASADTTHPATVPTAVTCAVKGVEITTASPRVIMQEVEHALSSAYRRNRRKAETDMERVKGQTSRLSAMDLEVKSLLMSALLLLQVALTCPFVFSPVLSFTGSIAAITVAVIAVVLLVFGVAAYLKIRHSSYGRLLDDHDYGSWGNYNNPLYDDS
ncbi:Prostate androgen-regulated mucin-like protein 1 [Galemys pyrenaicus]|uniref:Prostate androgen-regulated mucin-like protein 1 n=1 Tax=Galemys pyrenaicus TaxID=202257 RepID=A0A8J6ADI8_GALPY|nr:Prostate androgen-regulated mucin-like protein 1 [Galemys pyrenaicus]